jgi:hypothetical protein
MIYTYIDCFDHCVLDRKPSHCHSFRSQVLRRAGGARLARGGVDYKSNYKGGGVERIPGRQGEGSGLEVGWNWARTSSLRPTSGPAHFGSLP